MDDPHGGRPWGPERSVRARIIAWLLLLPNRFDSFLKYTTIESCWMVVGA